MYPDISINIHSSIRVANADLVVRFDPFKIPEKLHDTDIVFITHAHHDHFSPEGQQTGHCLCDAQKYGETACKARYDK